MAAFKRNIRKTTLPARRRVIRYEGGDAPPVFQRSGRGGSSFRGSPYRGSGSSGFIGIIGALLFRLGLIALAIGILYASKYLVDRLVFAPTVGLPPEAAIQFEEPQLEVPVLRPDRSLTVSSKVRKGDTLFELARGTGLPEETSRGVQGALARLEQDVSARQALTQGRFIRFGFEPDGVLRQIVTDTEPGKQLLIEKAENGEYLARIQNLPQAITERIAVGIIETSFGAAAHKAGVRYDIVDDLVDLFSDRVEFRKDFHVGDRFTVIYRDILLSDGRPAGGSQILAAALEVNGEHPVAARYVGSDGKARYFDEKGQLLGNSFLRYPLKFSRISSLFTKSRFHPVLKFKRPHNGVDFAAPIGTPVRTVADGTVVFSGRNGGSGNMVKIKHGDRYSTAYLHLNSISNNVKRGARLRRGDVIGSVGMTGLATGPHLHFSFYDNNQYVDPLKIKLPTFDSLDVGTKIDPNYLKRVLFTLEHYQTVELEHFYAE